MRRSFCLSLFLVGSLAIFACQEDEKRPPAASDTGGPNVGSGGGSSNGEGGVTDSGGVVDSGSDAGTACNDLVNTDIAVEQNRVVGDPPTGTGGSIADGTYDLTLAEVYVGASGTPGPSGVTYKGVLRLTNGKLERITAMTPNQGASPIVSTTYGDLVAGGSTFTVTQSCPVPFQDQYTYSVVSNKLNITSLITKESFTFTPR